MAFQGSGNYTGFSEVNTSFPLNTQPAYCEYTSEGELGVISWNLSLSENWNFWASVSNAFWSY